MAQLISDAIVTTVFHIGSFSIHSIYSTTEFLINGSNAHISERIEKIDIVNKKQISFPSKNIVKIDHTTPYKFPKIGIKIDSLIIPDDNLINNFDYYYYLIDFTKDLKNITSRSDKKVFLVALVDHANDPEEELTKIYNFIAENTINLDKILICPKIYLNSFQPAGDWPKVPEVNEYYKIAKKIFSNSQIVSGMVTNFTELNRKRPKMFYDLVSFSFTPIVHDSSDFGVLNTPETIPYIFKTLKNFSNSCDVHIGPISIGMHFNPYGESLVENKNKIRLEMADSDPRHDQLFSLTWTLAIFIQSINKEQAPIISFGANVLKVNRLQNKIKADPTANAKKLAQDISKSLNSVMVGEIMFKKFRNIAIFLDETNDHIRIKVYFQSTNDEVADHLENIFRSWPSLLALADGMNPELDEVMKHLKFSVIREKKSVGMSALLSHSFFETKVNEEIEKKKKAKEDSK